MSGLFGPRRPRDPERSRRTAKILLIAGVAIAVVWVGLLFLPGGGSKPTQHTHDCAVPKGATAGTELPPGNVPKLVAPLGPPDVSYTATTNHQTSYVYCYNDVTEAQAQAALQYVRSLGYQSVDTGDPAQSVGFTSDSAVPRGILLQVSDGLDLSHPGTGSGHLAVTWIDELPK
jgi:hypothetical protein